MKGRNTTCITIRLPDSVVQSLQEKAKEVGLSSVGEYIKAKIMKSYSAIATKPTQPGGLSCGNCSHARDFGDYGRLTCMLGGKTVRPNTPACDKVTNKN